MIQKDQIKDASLDVRRKAKLTHTFERGHEVYVIPNDPRKEGRIVIFTTAGILCITVDGVACEANTRGKVCYHCVAAAKRKKANRRRRETLQRKKVAA